MSTDESNPDPRTQTPDDCLGDCWERACRGEPRYDPTDHQLGYPTDPLTVERPHGTTVRFEAPNNHDAFIVAENPIDIRSFRNGADRKDRSEYGP